MANVPQKHKGQQKVATTTGKGKPSAPIVSTKTPAKVPAPTPVRNVPGTSVARRPSTDVAVDEGYGSDADSGFEDMGRDDFAIPFLSVLQSQSPQVLDGNDAQIDGAKPGMIINTVTKDLYDGKEGILFIPVHRSHQFIEWIPRDDGGGLVDIYPPDAKFVLDARQGNKRVGKIELENGHELAECFSVFGLLVTGEEGMEEFQQVLINFASSQIKVYKQWMTRAASISMVVGGRRIRPPLFAHVYRLSTKAESNKKGNWHGWNVAFSGEDAETSRLAMDAPWYQAAKVFREVAVNDGSKSLKAAGVAGMMPTDGGDGEGGEPDGSI